MKEGAQAFMHRLEQAFRQDCGGDRTALANAIAYMNHLDSVGDPRDCESALDTLDDEVFVKLPIAPGHPKVATCTLPVPMPKTTLYWVEDAEKVFGPDRHVSPALVMVAVKRANERLGSMQRNLLWLSDLDEQPLETLETDAVALGLGLYNKAFSVGLCVFAVETKQIHKPTWVDAGFTFYWYAAKEAASHGLTRDLRDGQPRFREWTARKGDVRITHYHLLGPTSRAATLLALTDLPSAYVDRCRREVSDCRTAQTATS